MLQELTEEQDEDLEITCTSESLLKPSLLPTTRRIINTNIDKMSMKEIKEVLREHSDKADKKKFEEFVEGIIEDSGCAESFINKEESLGHSDTSNYAEFSRLMDAKLAKCKGRKFIDYDEKNARSEKEGLLMIELKKKNRSNEELYFKERCMTLEESLRKSQEEKNRNFERRCVVLQI